MNAALHVRVTRLQRISLIVGFIALAASTFGALTNRKQFFFSYLFSWLFWMGLSLGCFLVTMIHHLTGGRLGYPTRRFLEAGFMALPLMLLLFIPICFGLQHLYPWAHPAEVAADPVLHQRRFYQNGW